MKKEWPRVTLAEVLQQIERPETIDVSRVYRLLGVRWYGHGLFVREERVGADIAANRVYSVHPGDFVYNRLFAWKGSFAVAGPESSGKGRPVEGCRSIAERDAILSTNLLGNSVFKFVNCRSLGQPESV